MWIKYLVCAVIGISSGITIAGGVFALFNISGLVPRLAGKTHTGKYVRLYETAIICGGTLFNSLWLYVDKLLLGIVACGLFGIFSGVFVGCLATAIAETLNTTAIFSRRITLFKGLGYIILFMAVGKMLGSLWYFYNY